MKLRRNKLAALLLALFALSMSGCQSVVIYEIGPLNKWYWSRLGWAVLITVILGVVAARFLCRLPIKAPLLDCIGAARRRFLWYLLLLALIITPLLLWFDAWLTQPFGDGNVLAVWYVLSLVILDWSTLAFMLAVAVVFYLTVAIFTRYVFAHACNCKFAFLPKIGN